MNRRLGSVRNRHVGWEHLGTGYYIYTMNINGIEYKQIECAKCNHQWLSKLEYPKKCPKCFRYDPWIPKNEKNENIFTPKAKRQQKYPIQDLQVGECVTLIWVHRPDGQPDLKIGDSMNRAVRQEEKRKGKKFERMPTPSGLLVTRVK